MARVGLVPAVDLLASCEGGYEPTGVLLWLPAEQQYGTWDNSHGELMVFEPHVTWREIAARPIPFLNAPWEGDGCAPLSSLVPWPRHVYSLYQHYKPLEIREGRQV